MLAGTLLAVAAAALPLAHGQVVGKAFGMATGTTGGGDATPQIPADYEELKALLSDDVPRVIVIDKEWDFVGTEGKTTTSGCEPRACPVSAGGQNLLGTLNCPDASNADDVLIPKLEYDAAADTPLKIASNKTLVGRGSSPTIAGKGLDLSGSTNVIVQNVHITNLNPQSVWGGDAVTLDGTDRVWIDRCTFSLIGRQMLVAGWNAAGRVTISGNEFDGRSPWSRTCNGEHYWAILLIGAEDRYTFQGNWLHDISGRAPHYGTDKDGATNVFHAVNNLFEGMSGHAFDAEPSTWSLIEGNAFINVSQPMTGYSLERANSIFDVPAGSEADCEKYIGRACEANSLDSDSGKLGEVRDVEALERVAEEAGEMLVVAKPAKDIIASVGL
ncbi:pectin lyase-like protein [Corynespora cassiicola Philippines]|uniref:pectin lyase n=1 Tax=Corynespora cassiicola Philippines TaxID=1448308 RepID=A0A2T2NFF1_CORCC|nr:pectin lyase-like protein [Corynespora cassiicola Philippines]